MLKLYPKDSFQTQQNAVNYPKVDLIPAQVDHTTADPSSRSSSSMLNAARDFCNETTIHGFNHIAAERRHWFERLVWLAIACAATWGAVSVSLDQWQRFNENPTVITLDKDFRAWSFPLAGITVCNIDKVKKKLLPEVIKSTWNVDPGHEKYDHYAQFVSTVANSDLLNLEAFQQYADDPDLQVDLFQLAVGVMYDFTCKASWVNNWSPRWLPVMTEMGVCYSTNSVALGDILIEKSHLNETRGFPLLCKFADFMCFMVLDNDFNMTVYAHSSYDAPDIYTYKQVVRLPFHHSTELTLLTSSCAAGVRELALRRRRCRYTDESPDETKMVYSTNMCHRSCRNKLAREKCGCKPFYNFYEEGTPCSTSGMACVSKLASKFKNVKCQCSLQCEDAVYKETTTSVQEWSKGWGALVKGQMKVSVQAPRTRYTREIVFHLQDLIVSFGGAAGLFLGASFLSFVEIVYFIINRTLRACARCGGDDDEDNVEQNPRHPRSSYESRVIKDLDTFLHKPRRYADGTPRAMF